MRPLTAAGLGVTLLVVDFRLRGTDLSPDTAGGLLLGWCLWLLGARRLALVSGAGAVASLAELHLPYHHRLVESYAVGPGGNPYLVEVEVLEHDPVTGVRLAATLVAALCAGVVVVALVRLVRARAGAATDPAVRVMAVAAAATVALWVAPRVVGMVAGALGDGFDPVWNDPWWRIELAGALAALVLAGTLLVSRREPWALPPGRRRTGNWARSA